MLGKNRTCEERSRRCRGAVISNREDRVHLVFEHGLKEG